MIVTRQFQNNENCSFEEFMRHLAALSEFNIGGVPLHLLAGSSWFVATNCEMLSGWFAKVVPNGTYVEGTTEHYRTLAKGEKNPYKWAGFHAWIEYVDEKSGREKVLDPCTHMVFDKAFYYENEKAEVINRFPCEVASENLKFKPTKNLQASEFDEFRFAFLMNTLANFTTADFGLFKNSIDEWAKEIEELNELEIRREEFKERFAPSGGKKLESKVCELFMDNVLFEGVRFEEQYYLLAQMIDRLEDYRARGFVDKDGKLKLPEKFDDEGNAKKKE